jgi:hypothetical protein
MLPVILKRNLNSFLGVLAMAAKSAFFGLKRTTGNASIKFRQPLCEK